ncbi:MAG TPA: YIP1 family protein [Acholeplasmataceae bacterium]|nr:YIP1 family protein [Acholeplasmataceae bacterium]
MKTKLKQWLFDFILFPKTLLFHPFDGFEEFKRYEKGKMSVAIVFIALFAFLRIFQFQYEGVLINPNNPMELNSLQEIFSVALLIFLFTVGNWSVTTLMEGKGKYKEILMVTGYALFPVVILGYPAIILSNFLTLEEMAFYTLLMGIAYALTAWMLFMGILNIHQYGLGKTILAFIATIIAMSVMMFLGLLFFDLIQQFISFIVSIYEELNLRY